MTCPNHSELIEFAFALAKQADMPPSGRHLSEHVAQCEDCKQELRNSLDMLGLLDAVLADNALTPTQPCLDDNVIAAYVDGRLSRAERDAAECHMAGCQRCLRQLADLSRLLEEVADSNPSILRFVIRVVQNGLRIFEHPVEGFSPVKLAPVSVLSADAEAQISPANALAWCQITGPFSIRFGLTQDADGFFTLTISAKEDSAPSAGGQFTLRREGRIVQSETLNNDGRAAFPELEAGIYDADIAFPSGRRLKMRLDLNALGRGV